MKTRYMQWRSRFFTKPTATSPRLQKYIDSNRLRTLLLGAFGSILITLSSYGVGWIADSSGFWRNNLIRTIRYEVSWVIVCIIALSLGAMIMCREWLRIYQKMGTWNNSSLRWMIAIVTCWSLPQVFALTIYSRDMFSYYGQGMVMAHGLNPYKQGVSEIANFMQNGADRNGLSLLRPTGLSHSKSKNSSLASSMEISISPFSCFVLSVSSPLSAFCSLS